MTSFKTSTPSHVWRYAPLLFLAAAVAACDGSNLFADPDGGDGAAPSISEFTISPLEVSEGGVIDMRVTASGPRPLTQILVQLSGAFEKDTVVTVPEAVTSHTQDITIAVPLGTGPGENLDVAVVVEDGAESVSEAVDTAIVVLDATPPTVSAAVQPADVGIGEEISIAVTASDNRGVASVGFEVTSANGWDTVFVQELATPAITHEQTFVLEAPDIDFTTLTVRALATDLASLDAVSGVREVELTDRAGPSITDLLIQNSTAAATVPLGDSVLVEANVSDRSGIRRVTLVGLGVVGDEVHFNDEVITRFDEQVINFPRPFEDTLPTDTTVRRRLGSADNTTTGPVRIFIIVEDGVGNISEQTYDIFVGGPSVRITFPPEGEPYGVPVDDSIEARITVYDPSGVDSAHLVLEGEVESTISLALPPITTDTIKLTAMINLPSTAGTITAQAWAWNSEGIAGTSGPRILEVLLDPPADNLPPIISLVAAPTLNGGETPRLEFTDTFRIAVTARDQGIAGLGRVGITADITRGGTLVHTLEVDTSFTPRSGNEEVFEFVVPLDSLYTLFGITDPADLDALAPDTIKFEMYAFAVDTAGAFACAVGTEESLGCTDGDPSTDFLRASATGLQTELVGVRGRSINLPTTQAVIADLAVDTIDQRVFLSNITENLVEVLDLDPDPRALTFLDAVAVGAQPWGLFIGERVLTADDIGFTGTGGTPGDTVRALIVANSGGTNLSLVHLSPTASEIEEVDVVRLRTANSVLRQIPVSEDENGETSYGVATVFDFSDRPQFLAQDSAMRLVYSTVSTETSPENTIRYAILDPHPGADDDEPEVRFFLHDETVGESETSYVLGNVDEFFIMPLEDQSDSVRICVHEPGYPNVPVCNDQWVAQFSEAEALVNDKLDLIMDDVARGGNGDGIVDADEAERASAYYPFVRRGVWDFVDLDMADTTYVVASGNRGMIAVAEGSDAPVGRIFLWDGEFSSSAQVTDLLNNASERVLGLALNWDGSLGVARGVSSTYFFTPDLRLQGLYEQPSQGGAGAAFHPSHNDLQDGGHHDPSDGAAFTGTSNNSVEVVNTFHFYQVTELFIRDNIVGPLKAGPPLADDNGGLGSACVDPDCVALKLYGVTDVGGVVVLNVRHRDLTEQP